MIQNLNHRWGRNVVRTAQMVQSTSRENYISKREKMVDFLYFDSPAQMK